MLDDLVAAGKIRDYGVCVEKVEEALKAIEYPGVVTVQIIYNIFRQRPAELFFRESQGAEGRGHRARAAGLGHAHRQDERQQQVRGRRPSRLQPQRRGLRQGRDFFGRAL